MSRRRGPFAGRGEAAPHAYRAPARAGPQDAIPNIERLVPDEQAHDLPVRDVDDRLSLPPGRRTRPRRRAAGAAPRAVEVRSREVRWFTLVEVAPHPDVAVGRARTPTRSARDARGRALSPGLHQGSTGNALVLDHCFVVTAPPRSATTTSAPRARSASACPTGRRPMTYPKFPDGLPATPASASSNTAAFAGFDAERLRRRETYRERVCRADARARRRAVDHRLEQRHRSLPRRARLGSCARRHDGSEQAAPRALPARTAPTFVGFDPSSWIILSTLAFLWLPTPRIVCAFGGSSGLPRVS